MGGKRGGVEAHHLVEMRALVRMQRRPVAQGSVPGVAGGGLRAAVQVGEGLLVRRHHAGPGAALDRHVADRHAAFHRQRADRLARIFDDVAGAARGADLADDGEDDVLGGDAGRQPPVHLDEHVLRLGLDQRLGGEHVLDLGRADAVRQRPEGAMRRGVAVAAHDGGAGQREALLGADDVDDALARCRTGRNIRCRTRGRCRPAFPPAGGIPARRCRRGGPWSGCCGRRRPACGTASAPPGPSCAGPRRPGGSSPRGRGGGRCRAGRCRRPAGRPRGRPRSCRRGCGARAGRRRPCSRSRGRRCSRSGAAGSAAAPRQPLTRRQWSSRSSAWPWRGSWPWPRYPRARRCGPTCRGGRAGNRAWRGGPCRGGRP